MPLWTSLAANKDELMEMITAGAEKIINTNEEFVLSCDTSLTISDPNYISLMINDDIDAIIQRGEERTVELNSKYEGLNLDDLNNFKSDATVQQWEGEDFRSGVSNLFMCIFRSASAYLRLSLFRRRKL
jgi:SWI/SNF-related matrix-associated actin-dependent regulator of chromatin subfamily A member 5